MNPDASKRDIRDIEVDNKDGTSHQGACGEGSKDIRNAPLTNIRNEERPCRNGFRGINGGVQISASNIRFKCAPIEGQRGVRGKPRRNLSSQRCSSAQVSHKGRHAFLIFEGGRVSSIEKSLHLAGGPQTKAVKWSEAFKQRVIGDLGGRLNHANLVKLLVRGRTCSRQGTHDRNWTIQKHLGIDNNLGRRGNGGGRIRRGILGGKRESGR